MHTIFNVNDSKQIKVLRYKSEMLTHIIKVLKVIIEMHSSVHIIREVFQKKWSFFITFAIKLRTLLPLNGTQVIWVQNPNCFRKDENGGSPQQLMMEIARDGQQVEQGCPFLSVAKPFNWT